MALNEFLKFDPRKFFLTLIIFSLLPVFAYKIWMVCKFGYCPPYRVEYTSLISIVFQSFTPLFSLHYLTVVLLPLGILVSYTFSCFVVRKVRALSPEEKEKFRKFFEITKWKIIISTFGWLTVLVFAMHFIVGIYGGLFYLPSSLYTLFQLTEILKIILLPFTFITFWMLFYFNLAIITGFLYLTKLPLEILVHAPPHPSNLTLTGGIIMILMLIFEWYIIACAVMEVEKLYRRNAIRKTRIN